MMSFLRVAHNSKSIGDRAKWNQFLVVMFFENFAAQIKFWAQIYFVNSAVFEISRSGI